MKICTIIDRKTIRTIMTDNTDYTNYIDYTEFDSGLSSYPKDSISNICLEQEKEDGNSGRKKTHVWNYFNTDGIKKHGHVGCICKACGWKRKVGKAYEMVEHLALSCIGATGETKNIFLQAIRDREALKITHPAPNINQSQEKKTKTLLVQPKITAKFENISIDNGKKQRCNYT